MALAGRQEAEKKNEREAIYGSQQIPFSRPGRFRGRLRSAALCGGGSA
ncbi:hypothetical protein HRbin09_00468 [bacterium HR09]|nr:hypothetical protein HRbin09_00468 [bacterium HR09]